MAAKQIDTEGSTNNQNDSITDTEAQSQSTVTNNSHPESPKMALYEPLNDRSVGGEINTISRPLDISEVYFSVTRSYELQSLSKYFLHEWSEAEHLFKSSIDFAEEIYSDWSPCPSPSPTSIGL